MSKTAESLPTVFPTYVGVFLSFTVCLTLHRGFPHVRGGVSPGRAEYDRARKFSPRTWGCFFRRQAACGQYRVFPTYVGVFPLEEVSAYCKESFPHVRGGVSTYFEKVNYRQRFSPRTWGCFYLEWAFEPFRRVFPTYVGVFLPGVELSPIMPCFPHVRGGVSILADFVIHLALFSPRTWGCFHQAHRRLQTPDVFPTYVGVFLARMPARRGNLSFPHVRGGVSKLEDVGQTFARFSPRTWGCFSQAGVYTPSTIVFPTYVGVFLALAL